MSCRSAKIEEVVNDATAAVAQIEKLESLIKSETDQRNAEFNKRINEFLVSSGIDDESSEAETDYIKVEYASEFSLDRITNVVKESLEAASTTAVAVNTGGLLSSDATSAYSDVVVAIGEAAKSTSSSATNGSFSATRLAPGILAFVYATSSTIKEVQTFGTEAITATAIHYKLLTSRKDYAKYQEEGVGKLRIAAALKAYKDFIELQAKLIVRLSNGQITFEEYLIIDEKYASKAESLRMVVKSAIDDFAQPEIEKGAFSLTWDSSSNITVSSEMRSSGNRTLVTKSLDKLSTFGKKYKDIIKLNEDRLNVGYFN